MLNLEQHADSVKDSYIKRYNLGLRLISPLLEDYIKECFDGEDRIDRISARPKSVDSYVKKSLKIENEKLKYIDPINQIQDQIGCRIIVFYGCDVDRVDKVVQSNFRAIEYRNRVPESDWEFGYAGRHYLLLLPTDVIPHNVDREYIPRCFELQVKTLFQHAWSEAGHDLGYKPSEDPLTADQKRRLAYTAAQAWGADRVFEELYKERKESVRH